MRKLILSVLFFVFTAAHAGDVTTVPAGRAAWQPGPSTLPSGIKIAVLHGDPNKKGGFTMRMKLPSYSKVPAYLHTSSENITVLAGAVNFGTGDAATKGNSTLFQSGSHIHVPANTAHFLWTGEEGAILQITTDGPWNIQFVSSKK